MIEMLPLFSIVRPNQIEINLRLFAFNIVIFCFFFGATTIVGQYLPTILLGLVVSEL